MKLAAVLLLILTLTPSGLLRADEAAALQPCPPDADTGGLIQDIVAIQVDPNQAKDKQDLDLLSLQDAIRMIQAYQRQRVALCAQLEARGAMVGALTESLSLTRQLLEVERGLRTTYQGAWKDAIARPPVVKSRWFDCVAGASLGAEVNGSGFAGPAVACGFSLLH